MQTHGLIEALSKIEKALKFYHNRIGNIIGEVNKHNTVSTCITKGKRNIKL